MTGEIAGAFLPVLGEDGVRVVEPGEAGYAPHPLPLVHLLPKDRDGLVACVREAHARGIPLIPVGGNTHPRIHEGATPTVLLSTEFHEGIVEHAVLDLVVTARSGTSIEDLEAVLARRRQKLPFSVARKARRTLGGVLATGHDGYSAHAYGRLRDQVLGLEVLHGDGQISKSGGRVVKNVTGFDLPRLHVGARGAFGIILSATLRIRAAERAACSFRFLFATPEEAFAAAFELRDRHPGLYSLHVVKDPKDIGRVQVVAHLRGEPEFVEAAAVAVFRARLSDEGRAILGAEAPSLVQEGAPDGWSRLRAGLLRTELAEVFSIAASALPAEASLVADVLTGLLQAGLPPEPPPTPLFLDWLARCPIRFPCDLPDEPRWASILRRHCPWLVPPPAAAGLVRRLRDAYDPADILNTGLAP